MGLRDSDDCERCSRFQQVLDDDRQLCGLVTLSSLKSVGTKWGSWVTFASELASQKMRYYHHMEILLHTDCFAVLCMVQACL